MFKYYWIPEDVAEEDKRRKLPAINMPHIAEVQSVMQRLIDSDIVDHIILGEREDSNFFVRLKNPTYLVRLEAIFTLPSSPRYNGTFIHICEGAPRLPTTSSTYTYLQSEDGKTVNTFGTLNMSACLRHVCQLEKEGKPWYIVW